MVRNLFVDNSLIFVEAPALQHPDVTILTTTTTTTTTTATTNATTTDTATNDATADAAQPLPEEDNDL